MEVEANSLEVIEATSVGMPALDILVPTHNGIELTKKCIQVLYFHTQSPFHLIVVDDSIDKITPLYFQQLITEGMSPLGRASNITFIHSNVPFKTGNQFFNLGFRYAKTEYIATVMNSMRVEPEWEIFALQNIMPNNPQIGIVGFKCLFAGDYNNVGHIESAGIKMIKYIPTDIGRDAPGHRFTSVYNTDATQWAFALLRKRAVVGVLDSFLFHGFRGWDDIDNCFVVKSKGWKIAMCGLGVGYHEPRATRGDNSPQAGQENMENGEKFYKRWGLWDIFIKEHPLGTDLHEMPKEIKQIQDYQLRTAFQQTREEVPV